MIWLLACPHPTPPLPTDPQALFEYASQAIPEPRPPDNAYYSRFSVNIATPTTRGPGTGTLILDFPDHLYLEVRPPIGGPALVAVSDGQTISVWLPGKNLFLTSPAANEGLMALAGVGVSAGVSLLSGRIPDLGTPLSLKEGLGMVEVAWAGPAGTRLTGQVGADSGRLTRLTGLDPMGKLALDIQITPGRDWPQAMTVTIPSQETTAEISFEEWKSITIPADRFVLAAPAGAEVKTIAAPAAP